MNNNSYYGGEYDRKTEVLAIEAARNMSDSDSVFMVVNAIKSRSPVWRMGMLSVLLSLLAFTESRPNNMNTYRLSLQ